ncbi:MAG: hypothetical protein RLZZ528_903 [Pseudomonadota bacterium]
MKTSYLALIVAAGPALAQTAPDPAVPSFADETAASGLVHKFAGGWQYMVGGGIAAFDCNADRLPELYFAGGRDPSTFFLNKSAPGSALAFEPTKNGLDFDAVNGAYPLDFDGDGITDLAVLRVGEDYLMRGKGDCSFERANEAWGFNGLDLWSTAYSATWEKGATWPTIAIGTYVDRTKEDFPWGSCTDNYLYRPDAAGKAFAPPYTLKPAFCTLSVLFTDWNRSGTPSLRVSNDREYYKGGTEQMWHVEAGQDPRLYTKDEGWQTLKIWGMGITSRDVTNDGYPEYFLTSMADNKLQTIANPPADGKVAATFADVAFKKGVIAQRPYVGGDIRPSTAWHPAFEDVNNDGLADLFIAKGNVARMPDFANADPNNLLLQRADGTFLEAGHTAGVASMRTARGAAVVDMNRDGWVDIAVNNRNEPAEIWRNLGAGEASWIQIIPAQDEANRDAIGAWVEVKIGDAVQRREHYSGGGHVGGALVPLHFGVGAASTVEVRVQWPDGSTSDWTSLASNSTWRILKGSAPEVAD